MRRYLLGAAVAAVLLVAPAPARATDVDPIACWWRTSVPALRVGQPFDVVLTCSVVETPDSIVVPDETKLDPAAVQFPPFEVLGGHRAPDLRTASQRFFQYQYSLRLITDAAFGRDVALPATQIGYRIDTKSGREMVQGRAKTFVLPALSLRVLSLVPADATGLREISRGGGFDAVEQRAFRARALVTVAWISFGLAAALAVAALFKMFQHVRSSKAQAHRELVPPRLVLFAVARELSAVAGIGAAEWTDETTDRAAAAVRIAGAYALGHVVSQTRVKSGVVPDEGQLLLRAGPALGYRVLVSAHTTPEELASAVSAPPRHIDGATIAALLAALTGLTQSRYGRGAADTSPLTALVDEARRVVRRLLFGWPLARPRRAEPAGWAR